MCMKKKEIVGLVHGVFDVLHYGHVLHFKAARKKVDKLICSVTDDKYVDKGPEKPLFKISERIEFLKNLKFFDEVVISNAATAVNIIKKYNPDFYFKGIEYKNKALSDNNLKSEIKALNSAKSKIIYIDTKIYSSSKIINNKFGFISNKLLKQIKNLKKDILKFKSKKFYFYNSSNLLIGENIIDKYLYTTISGKSNKSPIVSTLKRSEITYGGGVIIPANFFARFIKKISLITFVGKAFSLSLKRFLDKKIKKYSTKVVNYPIIKTRILDEYSKNKLFQITENEDHKINQSDVNKVIKLIKQKGSQYENIIFFNYGYQFVDREILSCLKKFKSKILINFQTNSYNYGFNLLNKFPSAKFVSMDELEFRLAVSDKHTKMSELIKKKINILKKYKTSVITAGKNGAYLIENKKIFHFDPVYKNLNDSTGCGDIFMSTFIVYKYVYKFSSKFSMIVAHIAAGIHGNDIGNNLNIDRDKLNRIVSKVINV